MGSITKHYVPIIRIALSAAIGMSSGMPHMGLAFYVFMPVLWIISSSRREAFATVLAFYLTSSRGVLTGAPVFFGDEGSYQLSGLVLWLATALSLAAPWGLLWCKDGSILSKILRLAGALISVSVPPLGMWGWSNPFLSTGYIFPGMGLSGMCIAFAIWVGVFIADHQQRTIRVISLCVICMYAIVVFANRTAPQASSDWYGAKTSYGRLYSGSDSTAGIYTRYISLRDIIDDTSAKYVVLPETVAGMWGVATERVWEDISQRFANDGRTFIVGAEVWESRDRYRNVMQIRGANNATLAQRCPVPVSMWRPWSDKGAISDIFGSGIVEIDGQRVGILICFEPYIFWPSFLTMLHRPDLLVVPSNSWWARETSLPEHSDQCVGSWSRLFGVPAVIAKNL